MHVISIIASSTYVPKNYPGKLSFATDAWTSPNNKPFVAFTVHFERDETAFSMLLDLVEVTKQHTGENLAEVFANVLQEFGIEDKVSLVVQAMIQSMTLTCHDRSSLLLAITQVIMTQCWRH